MEGSSVHGRALTPVIQTSHTTSLHYFSDSKSPRGTFDRSRDQTKTGGKGPAAARGAWSRGFTALGAETFSLSFAIT